MENQQQEQAVEKKPKSKRKLIILGALALFMILTIGMTWAFWSAGIDYATNDRDVNINIGTADRTVTVITLNDNFTQGGYLIPFAITPNANQVNEINFDITVAWNAAAGSTAAQSDALTGVVGNLLVELDGIFIGTTNVANEMGWANRDLAANAPQRYIDPAPLFVVTFTENHSIIGNDTTGVTFSVNVRMNIPYNRAMYDLVAGEQIRLAFAFTATPPADLA